MTADIRVSNIAKSFGDERVLRSVSLDVKGGKIVALLGPSGCGKTTLLRIIAGLVEQDGGSVFMDGDRVDGVPVNRRNVGFVFQNYSLFPHMTVRQNIEFGPRIRGASNRAAREKADELLEIIRMSDMAGKMPRHLSGGQQQRVALARAIATGPRVLLLDEPFGALDAKIRRRIRRDLKALQRELGITTIFVTHDQEEAFELGDMIAVMNEGRMEQVDLPRNLYERPGSVFVAKFVGNVNVLNGRSGKAPVLVRPEDVILEKGKGDGTLVNYVFLGPMVEVSVATPSESDLTALMSKEDFITKGFRRGDRVMVGFRRKRVMRGKNAE